MAYSEPQLIDIARALGRVEEQLIGQNLVLAELKADINELKAKPGRRMRAAGKWIATVAATVVAAVLAFKLRVLGK